jgi:hypothetical protein
MTSMIGLGFRLGFAGAVSAAAPTTAGRGRGSIAGVDPGPSADL